MSVSSTTDRTVSCSDLELTRPTRRRLVEPGVLDRDRCLRGEERDELLVVIGEVAPFFLGQIEVPVRHAPQQHRDAEERVHRWMTRREPDRAGIFSEVCEPQRPRLADEDAEDPAPARKVADRRLRLFVDAGGDEALQRAPVSSITPGLRSARR